MFGEQKIAACEELDEIIDDIGRERVLQMMECDGKYPEDFKQARAFCQISAALGNTSRPCLPSTPLLFQDQHDGHRMVVTLSGGKLSITSFGSTARLLDSLGADFIIFDPVLTVHCAHVISRVGNN